MNILMVNKFLYPRGGAETYMLKIGRYFERQGHKVQYFGMYDEKNIVGNELGLGTAFMDFRSKKPDRFLYPFRILYSVEAREKMKCLINHFHPDVIHLNNINFHLTPSIIDAAFRSGVPVVQTVHDFQMVCPNHMMLDIRRKKPCDKCIGGSRWNCVINKCIHDSYLKSILGCLEGMIYRYRHNYDKVSQYICPSSFMEQMLLRNKRYAGKTIVLQNFIQRKEENVKLERQEYVLYFGRLSEEKGIENFLKACKLLPDIPFMVAGSGPLEPLFRSHCPLNVKFVGFHSGQDLENLIRQARFTVFFPVWYENCPLAILESQSLGTPVLANAMGGIPELIQDGKTGVLIKKFTPKHYAVQIKALYQDKKKLEYMAANCRQREDFVTLDAYCRQLLQIYKSVMGKGKSK